MVDDVKELLEDQENIMELLSAISPEGECDIELSQLVSDRRRKLEELEE